MMPILVLLISWKRVESWGLRLFLIFAVTIVFVFIWLREQASLVIDKYTISVKSSSLPFVKPVLIDTRDILKIQVLTVKTKGYKSFVEEYYLDIVTRNFETHHIRINGLDIEALRTAIKSMILDENECLQPDNTKNYVLKKKKN